VWQVVEADWLLVVLTLPGHLSLAQCQRVRQLYQFLAAHPPTEKQRQTWDLAVVLIGFKFVEM
jgi:hypothetical protein